MLVRINTNPHSEHFMNNLLPGAMPEKKELMRNIYNNMFDFWATKKDPDHPSEDCEKEVRFGPVTLVRQSNDVTFITLSPEICGAIQGALGNYGMLGGYGY